MYADSQSWGPFGNFYCRVKGISISHDRRTGNDAVAMGLNNTLIDIVTLTKIVSIYD